MIKISTETRVMLVWLYNKYGFAPFIYDDIGDTVPKSLFDRFKSNKFIILEDDFGDHGEEPAPEMWRLSRMCIDKIIKRK